jgi:hypothetical protein
VCDASLYGVCSLPMCAGATEAFEELELPPLLVEAEIQGFEQVHLG